MNIFMQSQRLLKFIIAGAIATGIDFSFYIYLYQQLQILPAIAGSISFLVASLCNYFLNNHFTFSTHQKESLRKFHDFFLIAIGGLLLNYFLLTLITAVGAQYLLAKIITVLIVFIYNFTLHSLITFRVHKVANY